MDRPVIRPEVDALLSATKRSLRAQGISYATVASRLGLSVPTVKRALNGGDISLERLLAIAALAKTSLPELVDDAGLRGKAITFFTAEQDALFVRHPHLYGYFLELARGETPARIQKRHGLRRETTKKALSLLRRAGLVRETSTGAVHVAIAQPFGFSRESRYLAGWSAELTKELSAQVFAKFHSPKDDMVLLKSLALSPAVYAEMKAELVDVVTRYSARAATTAGDRALETLTVILSDTFTTRPPPPRDF